MSSQQTNAPFSISKERTNFARICWLLVDICTNVLRDVLRQEIPESQLSAKLAKKQHLLRLNASQNTLLFPPPSNKYNGNYTEFDISLLYTLMRNLCVGIQPHRKGWGKDPDPADRSLSANIERLRIIRNSQFGHMSETSIDDATFLHIWTDIRQVVVEIEQSFTNNQCSYVDAINELETASMDCELEQKYISLLKDQEDVSKEVKGVKELVKIHEVIIKQSQQQIDNHGQLIQRLDMLKDDHEHRLQELENTRDTGDTVKSNIIENTRARLTEHAKNACYTGTRVVSTLLAKLLKNKVVIITGKAGAGKTTAAIEVMRRLSGDIDCPISNGTLPAIINEAENWDKVVNSKDKMVIYVDDPFGKTNLDDGLYEKWGKIFDNILTCSRQGNVYFIVSIRQNILVASRDKIRKYELFSNYNIVDISAGVNQLNAYEKGEMLNAYEIFYKRPLKPLARKEIENTDPYYGFPQSCFLFFSNESFFNLGLSFFKHPDESLRKEIENLRRSTDNLRRYQYVVLVYILLKGKINTRDIDMIIVNNIGVLIGLDAMREIHIKDAVYCLSEVYLTKTKKKTEYDFKHETILDAVFLSFGELAPIDVISTCRINVLSELVKPEHYKVKPNEVVLKLSRNNYFPLVDRLVETKPSDCSTVTALNDREAILRILDEICSDPELEETLSSALKPSTLRFMFFLACRFGRTAVVKSMLHRQRPSRYGFVSWLKGKVTKSRTVSDKNLDTFDQVIIHGIYQSVVRGDLPTVKVILRYDKSLVNSVYISNKFVSMMHVAVLKNNYSMVKYLSSFNPDVTCSYTCDGEERTMLNDCIDNDCYDLLLFFFAKDPTLVNRVKDNIRPLICYAADMVKEGSVKLLLQYTHKDDLTRVDFRGESFIGYCVRNRWLDILAKLFSSDPATFSDAVLHAARYNKSNIFEKIEQSMLDTDLLEMNVTLLDIYGKSFPFYLAIYGHVDLLKALLEFDQTLVKSTDQDGNSLIWHAAYERRKDAFKLLCDYKADIKTFDRYGKTALHYCVDNDWFDILDSLITADHSLLTLTHPIEGDLICYAGKCDKNGIASLVRQFKINVTRFNVRNKTFLHYCVDNDWHDLLDVILKDDPRLVNWTDKGGDSIICYAARSGAKYIVSLMLKHRFDMTQYGSGGKTLLHYCVDNDWQDILEILVNENAALVELTDKDGETLVCYAARKIRPDMVTFLHTHKPGD